LVRIFIVYGGEEGENIGRQLESYFKSNKIGAFLASRKSSEIRPGEVTEKRIDLELKNANLAILQVIVKTGFLGTIFEIWHNKCLFAIL